MPKILINIPDEAIEKSLNDHKYMLDNDEKSFVDLSMMYTNGELEFIVVERNVNFYNCDYSVLPEGHGRLIDADSACEGNCAECPVNDICIVNKAPTVIEAYEGE